MSSEVSPSVTRDVDSLSYEELRNIGSSLAAQERSIARANESLREARAKLREREKLGLPVEGTKARIATLEASLASRTSNYESSQAGFTGAALSRARAAAPKQYRSGASQGSSASENLAIRQEQSASFQQARSLSSKSPGIYQYRGGGAFISQAAPGTFRNSRGELITIKEPIGQRTDKSFIYAPTPVVETRTISGFNLFDPQTRSAVGAAAASGSYANTGALYNAASAPGVVPEKPFLDRAEEFLSRKEFQPFLQTPLSLSFGGYSGIKREATRAYAFGERIEAKGFVRTGQYIRGLSAGFRDRPITSSIAFGAETVAFYGGGRLLTYGAAKVAPRLAARVGATRAITLLDFGRKAGTAAGVGFVATDLMTSTPYELGQKTPGYVAAGVGLGAAFSGSQLSPTTTITPSRFVRTRGSKIGATAGDFSVDVRSPFTVTESAYGLTRTIQPTARYRLSALSTRGFDAARGDVSVRLSGSLRYNSFLTGSEVSAPIEYQGVYRFGGFRTEPTILRQRLGGITVESMAVRRPADVLVLTQGRGRSRSTFVSEVFSQDFKTSEPGTYDILAGFRSTTYKGSRNPLITGTQEGGIRLAGLERQQPSLEVLPAYYRMRFPFGSQSFRTRAEALEVTGGEGVRLLRPEETTVGFGVLERYGQYRKSPRPIEDFKRIMIPEERNGPLYANIPLTLVRPQVRSLTEYGRSTILEPGVGQPAFARALPLPSLQGIMPRLASRRSLRPLTLPGSRLSSAQDSMFSLTQVRQPSTIPEQTSTTRLSLRETTLPRLSQSTIPRLSPLTPVVPGFFVPTVAEPLRPVVPSLLFLPGLTTSGLGAGRSGTRRPFGLSRTVVEVELGLGGRNLSAAPSGGFTGLEISRSFGGRRRRRR